MDQSAQDQEQFEQVLSRLDALIKRSHAGVAAGMPPAPPPTPVVAEEETVVLESSLLAEPEPQETAPQAEIPVLTEVYEDAADAIPVLQDALEEDADIEQAILDRWLPALQAAMNQIVEQETRRFQDGLQQRLQQEVAAALRQHIRGLKGQTEI